MTCTLEVKVHPGSSRREVRVLQDGVHLYTGKKPVQGMANRDAAAVLAECLNVPRSRVSLLRGARGRRKLFLIQGPLQDSELTPYLRRRT
ncbi:MAG: DUF167 domain-containing protein [Spirochaetota bacterium]